MNEINFKHSLKTHQLTSLSSNLKNTKRKTTNERVEELKGKVGDKRKKKNLNN